jgi:putative ABC transport system substrate-binding protein
MSDPLPRLRSLVKQCLAFTAGMSIAILSTGSFTAWAAGESQQRLGKTYRIGFLRIFACSDETLFTDLRQGLQQLGYTEGQNLKIDCRGAPGKAERLPDLATELVRLHPDVLITEGTQSTFAAQQATKTIPIVMVYAADPIAAGLVDSLGRPTRNVTGLSVNLTETIWKNLEILKELAPRISRIALFTDSTQTGHMLVAHQLEAAAKTMGVRLQRIDVLTSEALDGAFAAVLNQHAEALIVQPLFIGTAAVERIVRFAIKNRLPTMTFHTPYIKAGLLMLYGTNVPDHYRRAATYVDRILRGANPTDLPIEQPVDYHLVINQQTARALHLEIPRSLLQRADEISTGLPTQ